MMQMPSTCLQLHFSSFCNCPIPRSKLNSYNQVMGQPRRISIYFHRHCGNVLTHYIQEIPIPLTPGLFNIVFRTHAKFKFFEQLNPSIPKAFWKTTKYLNNQKSSIPILKDSHGQPISDDYVKASLLMIFSPNVSILLFPDQKDQSSNDYGLDPSCCPEESLCNEEEVIDFLLSLDTTTANGPDGISCAVCAAEPLIITIAKNRSDEMACLSRKIPCKTFTYPVNSSRDTNSLTTNVTMIIIYPQQVQLC